LTDSIGSWSVVYGFAFNADARNVLSWSNREKYGKNAVLFQSDGAVEAWHYGDEERQVIFPLCSEYNVIPLYAPEPGNVTVGEVDDEDEATNRYDSIQDVIADAEKITGKRNG
jgi:hypothetical protein